jgi:hypothetical protein
MSIQDFCKKNLMNYFIVVTGVTVAMAVLGLNFDRSARFGYEALLSPVVFGAVATLPSFILFSRKELSFRQMLIRRILHFAALELVLILFGYLFGIFKGFHVVLSFAFSVLAVYLFTEVIHYLMDSRTAGKINEGLKRIQG